ncbi:MAG: pyrimidine/purine nucleoside phosphorylase [Gammaproteobacteria bacterium]|nr:pyrimidine/purine nucleoside phosphorylase [Gammaproteobacteria bacterium]
MLKVNEYFDGNIKSIAFKTDTLPATVGVMVPGEYVFNTADKEKMTIVNGALTIKLPGETSFTTYKTGESFDVAANSAFDVKVENETAYLCLYG